MLVLIYVLRFGRVVVRRIWSARESPDPGVRREGGGPVDVTDVRSAIAPLAEGLRADGADVLVERVATDRVELRLVLEDASCAECVMPVEVLEPLFLDAITTAGHDVATVAIGDPRRGP
jgi:hypothetical protein